MYPVTLNIKKYNPATKLELKYIVNRNKNVKRKTSFYNIFLVMISVTLCVFRGYRAGRRDKSFTITLPNGLNC